MIQMALADYTLVLGERLPKEDDPDCAHVALAERCDVAASIGQRHPRRDGVSCMSHLLCQHTL